MTALPLIILILIGLVAGSSAAAQQLSARPGAAAEIGASLRSFYFNLAHHDWEALTANILAAKVVAHRTVPAIPRGTSRGKPEPIRAAVCSPSGSVSIKHAVITIRDDWAEVSVPRCAAVPAQDEFRLVWFAGRWRFVSIQLQQPAAVMVGR